MEKRWQEGEYLKKTPENEGNTYGMGEKFLAE